MYNNISFKMIKSKKRTVSLSLVGLSVIGINAFVVSSV